MIREIDITDIQECVKVMPMAFGFLQQYIGIAVMPFWLLLFAGLNIGNL